MIVIDTLDYVLQTRFIPHEMHEKYNYDLNMAVEKKFNQKYSLISFNKYKEEILLEYALMIREREMKKKLLKEVIDECETNEETRNLYNNRRNTIKELYKSRELEGIPEEIIQNQEYLRQMLDTINTSWMKIVDFSKNRKTRQELMTDFTIEDSLNVINVLNCLRGYAGEESLDYFIDTQLSEYLENLERANLKDNMYNPVMTLQIAADFNARLNTMPYQVKEGGKRRTKETIFDWMLKTDQPEIRKSKFIESYEEMVMLYESVVFNSEEPVIDKLIYYYALERDYNFICYDSIIKELCLVIRKKDQTLLNRIKELISFNAYIYRSEVLIESIHRLSSGSESIRKEIYEAIKKELYELTVLKYEIARELTKYRDLKDTSLVMKELNELISQDTKELVESQARNLDFNENEELDEKIKSKYIAYLRELIRNNANMIHERHRLTMEHIFRSEIRDEELEAETPYFNYEDSNISDDLLKSIIVDEDVDDV